MFYIYHTTGRIDIFVADGITSWDDEGIEFNNLKSGGWIDSTSAGFTVFNEEMFVFYPTEPIEDLSLSMLKFNNFDDRFEKQLWSILNKINPNQYHDAISGVMNI